jgi:hypothetical protein
MGYRPMPPPTPFAIRRDVALDMSADSTLEAWILSETRQTLEEFALFYLSDFPPKPWPPPPPPNIEVR